MTQQQNNPLTPGILAARSSDIPELLLLMRQYWEYEQLKAFNPHATTQLLQNLLAHPEYGLCWIARDATGIQAYLLCSCLLSLEYGGLTAAIVDLYVTPHARRQGVGRQLVWAAEHAMQQRGCVHIEMEIAEKNFHAQQFYSILGFSTRAGYSMMHKPL